MNTMTMVLKPQELLGQQFVELSKFLFGTSPEDTSLHANIVELRSALVDVQLAKCMDPDSKELLDKISSAIGYTLLNLSEIEKECRKMYNTKNEEE